MRRDKRKTEIEKEMWNKKTGIKTIREISGSLLYPSADINLFFLTVLIFMELN